MRRPTRFAGIVGVSDHRGSFQAFEISIKLRELKRLFHLHFDRLEKQPQRLRSRVCYHWLDDIDKFRLCTYYGGSIAEETARLVACALFVGVVAC
jgi:hypothetical protein